MNVVGSVAHVSYEKEPSFGESTSSWSCCVRGVVSQARTAFGSKSV